ncbi:hypothetical protein [Shinella zoogloeoides]|uniref:Uncharacterized protein n=1 Tax=Shinella zoogloeoides TaxID=352475 RepID=A0A6N8TEX3_SHIZO|nr:hypothetical protein [Shinella zoogloeoides]MXO01191.1 hypothetical protein [Shinella zoogloeoides]UEX81808.1 hypothetical protein K8M09_00365 [Shinella zoogloeoides]
MRSDAVSSIRPTVRYRPGVPRPEPRRRNVRRSSRATASLLDLQLDLPDPFPVSAHEVAAIETFLGERIDALLKDIPRRR